MIPLQLTLRNFLSYRDTAELDLSGIHLACISGLNGVGKSTILEGMTWALFGKSRVRSDDDVVNRSAAAKGEAAEVSFTFELEGAVYRIMRRKAPGKTSELEFNARAPGEDGDHWQVKTEARIRETQAEIEKLLRMNYEVFTNASFLLQGKADEFTTKTADKRKEILADILGVNLWDEYKERAAERRKEADGEAADFDRRIAEVEAELVQEEELIQAREKAELQVKTVTAERDRQDALVAAARRNKALADSQRESLGRTAAELAKLETELERNESLAARQRAELAGHRATLDRREAIAAAFEAWQKAGSELAALQVRAEEHAAISREMHPLELAIARAESRLQQQVRELESQQEKAGQAAAELANLQAGLIDHESRRNDVRSQLDKLAEQQSEWQTARDRLQAVEFEREQARLELNRLQSRAKEIATLEEERKQVETSLHTDSTSLDNARHALQELADKRESLEAKSREKAALDGEKKHLRAEMDDLKARMTTLETGGGDNCPLCGQTLTADHRRHAIKQINDEGTERAARFHEITALLKTLEKETEDLNRDLPGQRDWEKKRDSHQAAVFRFEERLKTIDSMIATWRESREEARAAELEKKLADSDESAELIARMAQFEAAAEQARQLDEMLRQVEASITRDRTRCEDLSLIHDKWESHERAMLESTRRQLAEGKYADEERAALAKVNSRLAAVAYDAEAHEAARSRLGQLANAPEEHQQYQQAEAAVKPLAESLAELERRHEIDEKRAADLQLQRQQDEARLQALVSGIGDLNAAEDELQRLRETAVAAISAAGVARQKVDVLDVRREDRKKMAAQKTTLMHQISLLRQLEDACGRKGVQALLIDAALPEIEDYANNLLDRLSGGDMRIQFETQRASKSKVDNPIETLDIIIGDSFGVRPYENYSGGEKFRVNFAIRLALSQVLARRAGARLQTLVIDEGFGSQDPEGRQRLVEAINAVQDEFACILVITHIDELRDKFPARIDVEKTANGSRFSVVTI